MKRTIALVAALVWPYNSTASSTYELFESPSPIMARWLGEWFSAVAIGDVTGDGLDDIVVATPDNVYDEQKSYLVKINAQMIDGSFDIPLVFKYAEFSSNVDVKLGDVDNNGVMDVVIAHGGAVTMLMADGAGGFLQNTVETTTASYDTRIELVDVDFDGNLDIVAVHVSEGGFILFGDGQAGVARERLFATTALPIFADYDIEVGDVTGDSKPDLIVASGLEEFRVYPHNGVDGFGEGVSYSALAPYPTSVAVGDLNSDGLNDVAMSAGAYTGESSIWIYPGSPSGELGSPTRLPAPLMPAPRALLGRDLDRDGLTDLLQGQPHVGWTMQANDGLGAETLVYTEFEGDSRMLAAGDWNDDGCTDVAFGSHAQSDLTLLQGRNCAPITAVNDFNGDGRSDLFWHNAGTGANVIWRSADYYYGRQPVVQVANPSWQVKGHGDFDGDGRADVLWRNVATGAGAIWRSGDFATQQPVTRVTNLDWTIAGIGDFDGDGKDDLLWRNRRTGQNAIWKAADYRDQQAITAVTDSRWTVVAVDDFNGDRKDDILWRHTASGGAAIWRSGDYRDQQPVTGVRNLGWQVAGTGDFNGDDRADILWRNERSGANAIWNSADIDDQSLVADMDDDLIVAAIGDHDGNRNAEIVWRNRVTGENQIWRAMNATLYIQVADVRNPAWHVVP